MNDYTRIDQLFLYSLSLTARVLHEYSILNVQISCRFALYIHARCTDFIAESEVSCNDMAATFMLLVISRYSGRKVYFMHQILYLSSVLQFYMWQQLSLHFHLFFLERFNRPGHKVAFQRQVNMAFAHFHLVFSQFWYSTTNPGGS